mmetsp:Transcript_18807/g.54173  ORF Transcript_18807/g.54173 Transcript_18807/m.54173 type:complete len:280 (-) Transcript_18807:179-1018(-)
MAQPSLTWYPFYAPESNRLAAASKLLSVCPSARITACRSNPIAVSCAIASSDGGGGGGGCCAAAIAAAAPPPPKLGAILCLCPPPAPPAPAPAPPLAAPLPRRAAKVCGTSVSSQPNILSGNSIFPNGSMELVYNQLAIAPHSTGWSVPIPPLNTACSAKMYVNDFSLKSNPINPKNLGCNRGAYTWNKYSTAPSAGYGPECRTSVRAGKDDATHSSRKVATTLTNTTSVPNLAVPNSRSYRLISGTITSIPTRSSATVPKVRLAVRRRYSSPSAVSRS